MRKLLALLLLGVSLQACGGAAVPIIQAAIPAAAGAAATYATVKNAEANGGFDARTYCQANGMRALDRNALRAGLIAGGTPADAADALVSGLKVTGDNLCAGLEGE